MYFIIQGDHLREVEDLLRPIASPTSKRLDSAWYFEGDAELSQKLEVFCQQHQLDLAILQQQTSWSDIKLLAMDMDSTLINIECIDEIADMQGLKPQVAAITAAAMRGEIEFQESLRRRVALLENLPTQALHDVLEHRLRLNPGAEALIQHAQKYQITTLLVSGGFTFFTETLKERLSLNYAYANQLDIQNDRLTGKVLGNIVDGQKKAEHVAELKARLNCEPTELIVIGDGANDLPMMAHSQFSIAYHAKPVVQESARFVINHCGLDSIINLFTS